MLTKLVVRSYVKPWWVWTSQAHLSRRASAFGWAANGGIAEGPLGSGCWGTLGRRQLLRCGALPGLGVCAAPGGVHKWLLEGNLHLRANCGVWGVCREQKLVLQQMPSVAASLKASVLELSFSLYLCRLLMEAFVHWAYPDTGPPRSLLCGYK